MSKKVIKNKVIKKDQSNKKVDKTGSKKDSSKNKVSKDKSQEKLINKMIVDTIKTFTGHLEGINTSAAVIMPIMTHVFFSFIDKRSKFLSQNAKLIKEEGKTRFYKVPVSQISKIEKIDKEINQLDIARNIIPKSLIVMLISQFDYLVGRLIHCLYNYQPGLLNSSERQLTSLELNEFGSIQKAQDYFLEKEIESVMRKSHSEQFDWLEHTFRVPLRKGLDIWPAFIELTERRNLFVHTNGVVSSQYINVCKKTGVDGVEKIKVNDTLDVDGQYFKNAYKLVYELGIKLSQVLWRKIMPSELINADRNINDITYELLKTEQYDISLKLLDFLFSDPAIKFPDDACRRIHIVNRAIAYKWLGRQKDCLDILDKEDWSSTKLEFQLAVHVLKEKYDLASKLMRKIGRKSDWLDKNAYQNWPLFKEYRKTKDFEKAFKNIYGSTAFDVKESNKLKAKRKKV